jgi:hypothetical protein
MGLSVLERISQNVESTLGNLTTQSGYQLSIQRARLKVIPQHLSGFIYQLSPTDVTDAQIGTDEWKQSYAVVMYVQPTEDDTTPVDSYNNDIAATIYTALQEDLTRGGLALDTIIHPMLFFPPIEGEFSGITFMFDVHYRTAIYKPYVALS